MSPPVSSATRPVDATRSTHPARAARGGVVALALAIALCASPPPAGAISLNPVKKVCSVAGILSGLLGKACDVLQGGRLAKAGGKLLSGNPGGAAKALVGSGARVAGATLGFAAIGAWVLGGAKAALRETETEIGKTTSPRLQSTWFSSTYWRVAGLAALLTLPFLFAAALQALLRSDLSLLGRAAFGYLPLSLLAVSIAAPLIMLVLAASDEMCTIVSSASGGAGLGFLKTFGFVTGGLSVVDGSPFLAFLLGALIAGAALAISLELLVREAAVYVVVLMLPLAFAGMVWPARRMWAVRAIETLVALILAKFAIVAVLALAGGALSGGGASGMFAGAALLMLAAFSPLVLFRLLPFAELAAGASGALRGERSRFDGYAQRAGGLSGAAEAWAASVTDGMSSDAERSAVAASGGAEEPLRLDPAGRSGQPPVARAALEPPGTDDGTSGAAPSSGPPTGGAPDSGALDAGSPDGGAPDPLAGGDGGSAASQPTPYAGAPPSPRLPGMDPLWQAGNGEWEPLVFDPGSPLPTAALPLPDSDPPLGGDPPDADREQDDGPLPPAQDPEGGRL